MILSEQHLCLLHIEIYKESHYQDTKNKEDSRKGKEKHTQYSFKMIKAGFYNTRENVGCKQTLDNLQLLEKLANHPPWSTATETSNELMLVIIKIGKKIPTNRV